MAVHHNPLLESAGKKIVEDLGGRWHAGKGMCRCPAHGDKTPSLSVRVGDKSLLFHCFAGCNTLDVLQELRVMKMAVPIDGSATPSTNNDPAGDRMRARARELWDEAQPIATGIADRYLLSRGLEMRPAALRFHPRTPFGPGRYPRRRPSILAAVAEPGRFTGLQRIPLEPDGSGLARDLPEPKRGLARPLGGAVQLFRPGPILGLAEGVETAMSAAFLLGIPVWAALGAERLHQIIIPRMVERLLLLPDNDRAGSIAVGRAETAYAGRPFDLDLEWPWFGLNDWNDVLRRPELWEGREGVGGVRLAA
ncbi:toprim domain-containing protein [Sphingomonas sp. H39-1-10]|uniref:DUF7146 domain-containing protein n=1 Tax=Sphingomonas pollutisoli TaxID=3030829 RepID=UPI0023B9A924|nr:toprim domain-containing protein [Sphingomonas pollutisoli]MDF0490160.1 toprim domain-containing protein [Sphingomonas pollutisoli]